MTSILPNFLIPGAGKSGTTYVASILRQHPEIYIPTIKEPAFLSTFPGRGFYHKGLGFYKKHFKGYDGEKMIGEASTVYMYDPVSPQLIIKHLGKIKLIFILRDPIDRVYSNYWQEFKAGRTLPDFNLFITSGQPRAEEMIHVSQYNLHLERYYRYFDNELCLVKSYNQLKQFPQDFFDDITKFLGVSSFPDISSLATENNPAAVPRNKLISRIMRNRQLVQNIKSLLPGKSIEPLKKIMDQFKKINQKQFDYPPLDEKSREYLRERLAETFDYLENKLGFKFDKEGTIVH